MPWSEITSAKQVLKVGDVILAEKKVEKDKTTFELQQIPQVQGALVVMDPHTGRVLAIQGGWKYGPSQFNRATQAKRQAGSAFKPFIYLAALDKGFHARHPRSRCTICDGAVTGQLLAS